MMDQAISLSHHSSPYWDKRNPQIAARLGLTLTRFQHYAPARQALMQDALAFLSQQDLSPDLSEIVMRALA